MVTCPCCKNLVPKLHGKSHVLPKWMCKGYLSDKGKVILVDVDDAEVNPHAQSAPYGTFWCQSCEERSAKADAYGRSVLQPQKSTTWETLGISKEEGVFKSEGKRPVPATRYSGLDYGLYQRFVLSIVLRFELWWRSMSKGSVIGDKHFENLITIYLSDEPESDPLRYPIMMEQLTGVPDNTEVGMLSDLEAEGNHRGTSFRAAGHDFLVIASSHQKPQLFRDLCLQFDGSIVVIQRPFVGNPGTNACVEIIHQVRRKIKTDIKAKTSRRR